MQMHTVCGMLTVAAAQGPVVSGPVMIIVLLGAGLIFRFGYALAVMRRARRDHKTTKAAVPVLRKGFWHAVGVMLRAAVFVAVGLLLLTVWVVHDVRAMDDSADTKPTPSVSTRSGR